jgi:predicted aspartyl protease
VQVSAATVSARDTTRTVEAAPGKKKKTRWRRRKEKKQEAALVQAAAEVLSALQHDSSQLMVVSAVVDGHQCADVLVDPGASSNFVRQDWVRRVRLPTEKLSAPLEVTLADGKVGATLTHVVRVKALTTQGSTAPCHLTVMERLSHEVILGLPWLRRRASPSTTRACSGTAQQWDR